MYCLIDKAQQAKKQDALQPESQIHGLLMGILFRFCLGLLISAVPDPFASTDQRTLLYIGPA